MDQVARDGEGGPVRLDEILYDLVFEWRELDFVRVGGLLSFRVNRDDLVGGGKGFR